MPNKSKAKGNRFERELVKLLESHGWVARRAWGSDGRALGKTEGVDITAVSPDGSEVDIQAKSRASLAEYIYPPEGCDITIVKGDRREPLVVITLEEFLTKWV